MSVPMHRAPLSQWLDYNTIGAAVLIDPGVATLSTPLTPSL